MSAAHAEQPPAADAMLPSRPFLEDPARPRRQAAAQELATILRTQHGGIDRPTESNEGGRCCAICMNKYASNERVAYLHCRHLFHTGCIDDSCATRLRRDGVNEHLGCPLCRGEVDVAIIPEVYDIPSAVDELIDALASPSGDSNASIVLSFPIFPAQLGSANPTDGTIN